MSSSNLLLMPFRDNSFHYVGHRMLCLRMQPWYLGLHLAEGHQCSDCVEINLAQECQDSGD